MKWIETLARFGVVATLATFGVAAAQAATCGMTGQTVTSLGIIDPFAPSGTSIANFTLRVDRFEGPGGQKTQKARFYLSQPAGGTDYTIRLVGAGSDNSDVAHVAPYVPPGYVPITGASSGNSSINGVLEVNFTGNDSFANVPLSVTIPPDADLSSGLPIQFNLHYYCQGTGGMDSLNTAPGGLIQNAVTLTVNVLSALQASYVGPALAFGEIGDLTTAGLGAAGTGRTRRAGDVRVRSSGPYTVALTSQNGFFMTYAGNGGLPSQKINYQLSFLNQIITGATATTAFTTVTCNRAGVPMPGQLLGIQADLLEGGQGKAPSPNYQDILTITVTPLVTGSGTDCSALAP